MCAELYGRLALDSILALGHALRSIVMPDSESNKTVFILADGTGETAEKVATAALTQFRGIDTRTQAFTRVRSKIEIREVMERAARDRAFVVYTVIDPEHRDYIQRLSQD